MELIIKTLITELIISISICNIFPYKLKKKDYLFITFLIIIISKIIEIFDYKLIILITFLIPMLILYLKSKNIIVSCITYFISIIISILIEYIIGFIVIRFTSMRINNIGEISITILGLLVLIISYYISYFTGKIIKDNISVYTNNKTKSILKLILFTVLLISVIFYVNLHWSYYKQFNNNMININNFLFLVYLMIILLAINISSENINKEILFKNKQEQLNNLQQYTNNLENLYTDMRRFRHDYVNIIASIIGYIDEEDLDGLKSYINNNIIPLSKTIGENNSKIKCLRNIKMLEIKGIISSKIIRAQELGVEVDIEIVEPIEKIDINIVDLSRVIGILIDNAIEEALNCTEKEIKLALIKKRNSVIILVINSCRDNIPPIKQLYKEGFSTKGNNRGIGLSNLKDILDNYNNIMIDTTIKDNFFVQNIEIINDIRE